MSSNVIKFAVQRKIPLTPYNEEVFGESYIQVSYGLPREHWLYRLLRHFGLLIETQEVHKVNMLHQPFEVETVCIDTDKVRENLTEQFIEYMNRYGRTPDLILMGNREFDNLLFDERLVFDVEFRYCQNNQVYFRNVRVATVRHMHGALVLRWEDINRQ